MNLFVPCVSTGRRKALWARTKWRRCTSTGTNGGNNGDVVVLRWQLQLLKNENQYHRFRVFKKKKKGSCVMHRALDTVTGSGGYYCVHVENSRLRRIQMDLNQFGTTCLTLRRFFFFILIFFFFNLCTRRVNLEKVTLTPTHTLLSPFYPLFVLKINYKKKKVGIDYFKKIDCILHGSLSFSFFFCLPLS